MCDIFFLNLLVILVVAAAAIMKYKCTAPACGRRTILQNLAAISFPHRTAHTPEFALLRHFKVTIRITSKIVDQKRQRAIHTGTYDDT